MSEFTERSMLTDLTWTSSDGVDRAWTVTFGGPYEYIAFLQENGATNICIRVNGEVVDSNIQRDFSDQVSCLQSAL